MAGKKQNNVDALADAIGRNIKFRSFKNDGKGFDDLEQGEEITGILLGVRDQEIKDKRTKQLKMIRVYSIRVGDGESAITKKIGSRALLDGLFDDIMDEHGGVVVMNNRYEGPGMDFIKGKMVRFIRGENRKTADNNPMGTYEIQVEDE